MSVRADVEQVENKLARLGDNIWLAGLERELRQDRKIREKVRKFGNKLKKGEYEWVEALRKGS